MSLADAIAAHAAASVDDHAPGWLDRGLEAARGAVAAEADQVEATSQAHLAAGEAPPAALLLRRALLTEAAVGVEGVADLRDDLLLLGRAATAGALVHLAGGRPVAAGVLIATAGAASSFRERRSASTASTEATLTNTAARVAARDRVLAKAGELGIGALRVALPFLLAAL